MNKDKFQIKTYGNENLAQAILDKLSELGYDACKGIICKSYQVNAFSDNTVTYSSHCHDKWGEFITIDELFAMTPKPAETIKIGDQTFNKAEFEEATKNLKPVK